MRKIFFPFLALSVLFFLPSAVLAATQDKPKIRDEAYAATYVSQTPGDPIEIEAGKMRKVTLRFKNIGTAAWNASGARFVSAYTMEPRNRLSAFRGGDWPSGKQTPAIEKNTPPGGIAELTFEIRAPSDVKCQMSNVKCGEYIEQFYLAAENWTWLNGGNFFLKIRVVPASSASPEGPLNGQAGTGAATKASNIKANRFIQNIRSASARGGEVIELVLGFQNIGKEAWKGYTLVAKDATSVAAGAVPNFADTSWQSRSQIVARAEQIDPGEFFRETIRFRAPARVGAYTASFRVQIGDTLVEDPAIEIPVAVTEDAPAGYSEPWALAQNPPDALSVLPRLSSEPIIRVGIWKPEGYVQVQSQDADYDVYDGDNRVGILPRGRVAVLQYDDGVYSYRGVDLEFSTREYIRLVPSDFHASFAILNRNRVIKWKGGSRNFNIYRGALEYRLTQDGKAVYVINELLLEDYLAGIGESSNIAPYEYIKALQTAARTYAYYIQQYTDKHDKRNFDVISHTGDQLYLGVVNEQIAPRVVSASQDTRGYMVTYGGNIVITPYFGNSDTRTRAWTEVWGGEKKPWLVSVLTTYDRRDRKRKLGHGVGMSQRDAAFRAEEEGVTWQDLLKYYYTGVAIEKMYD